MIRNPAVGMFRSMTGASQPVLDSTIHKIYNLRYPTRNDPRHAHYSLHSMLAEICIPSACSKRNHATLLTTPCETQQHALTLLLFHFRNTLPVCTPHLSPIVCVCVDQLVRSLQQSDRLTTCPRQPTPHNKRSNTVRLQFSHQPLSRRSSSKSWSKSPARSAA